MKSLKNLADGSGNKLQTSGRKFGQFNNKLIIILLIAKLAAFDESGRSNQNSKSGPEGKPSASYGVKFLSKKVRPSNRNFVSLWGKDFVQKAERVGFAPSSCRMTGRRGVRSNDRANPCGRGEIRTRGGITATVALQATALDHYATLPFHSAHLS